MDARDPIFRAYPIIYGCIVNKNMQPRVLMVFQIWCNCLNIASTAKVTAIISRVVSMDIPFFLSWKGTERYFSFNLIQFIMGIYPTER